MREGNPTTLIVAAGNYVTVNAILGLPFITQSKMVIITSNQVVNIQASGTPAHFPN
jgi:hypothetical protein